MTREEVVKLIEESELTDDKKRELLNMIIDSGLTPELKLALMESFEESLLGALEENGVDVAGNEDLKKADADFAVIAEEANTAYEATMAEVETGIKEAQTEANQALDDLQAQVIKDKLAE